VLNNTNFTYFDGLLIHIWVDQELANIRVELESDLIHSRAF
jgi:hypothetical protein